MNPDESAQRTELDAALTIAKRASMIVLALGLVELVYGIVGSPAGTFRLNFGGLLVGLLMLFGGLRVLSVVRWLALLALGICLVGLFTPFVIVPAGLTFTQMRLYPLAYAASCIPTLVSVGIALTAALRLSHPQLAAARARLGRSMHSARIPLAIGLVLALGGMAVQYRVLGGEAGQKARQLAADQLGPGYRYYTSSLNTVFGKPNKYFATVEAWNDNEVRVVPVQWEE